MENGPEYDRREPIVSGPVSDMLRDPGQAAAAWPEFYAADASFAAQIEVHAERSGIVTEVVDRIPVADMTFEEAIGHRYLSEAQAGQFYDTLSDMLADRDYRRLLLYLPLDYLPQDILTSENTDLAIAGLRFKRTYMAAWHELLATEDVRANFVDGDVLEKELRTGDLPRVVKAAHLAPKLLELGWLSETEVIEMADDTASQTLSRSLNDALTAYRRPGFNIPAMRVAFDGAVFGTRPGSAGLGDAMTEQRRAWLERKQREDNIMRLAGTIAQTIIWEGDVEMFMKAALEGYDPHVSRHILAEGIYQAIEYTAAADSGAEQDIFELFAHSLDRLMDSGDPELDERLDSIRRRLYRLGVADAAYLAERGTDVPELETWTDNLAHLDNEIDDVKRLTGAIEADSQLRDLVHPVVLMGGSRLKGYGSRFSDTDLGLFVKPGVPETAREFIRERVEAIIGNDAYEPTEFWLEEDAPANLRIYDFEDYDRHTGDSRANHVLLNAVWIGDSAVINDIRARLMPEYFKDRDIDPRVDDSRRLHIEKLEQDSLQYRLLHKGYARHYPLTKRPEWTYDDAVDGHSVFWDPGYRRLATKLFVRTVFLPKIER